MRRNETAYEIAQDWIRWLDTRRFFAPPEIKNILAQYIPSKQRPAPSGPMSQLLNSFNLAVVSLDKGHLVPFLAIYCDLRPTPIKTMAYELGIGRDAFYERAHIAASYVLKTARRIKSQ